MALGVLAQQLGPYKRAVAYFSKQLDEVSKGWPTWLRAVAAVVVNIEEARKLTMGQKMTVLVSPTVSVVLEKKGNHALSPSRFLKYQAILAESDDVTLQVTNIVDPASFLKGGMLVKPIEHDCMETMEAVYSSCPDLKEPFQDADNWFSDGSSFVKQGYTVTTMEQNLLGKLLQEKWEGPFQVLLTTFMAVQLKELGSITPESREIQGKTWKAPGSTRNHGLPNEKYLLSSPPNAESWTFDKYNLISGPHSRMAMV
ncbi:hypothetical protein BTVI_57680 [Pitangus sulphuratus]|nr:hypothetical protein BTVI_57680 [Pitangus sulphuratus]